MIVIHLYACLAFLAFFCFSSVCLGQLKTGTEPSWSPDGKKIIFTSGKYPEGREIFVMNTDGSNIVRLTENSFADEYPMWSPDGKKILFSSNREGSFKLFIMNSDGANPKSLGIITSNDQYDPCRAAWSPDGSKIIFPITKEERKRELHIANPDGTELKKLTDLNANNPRWSPDGRKIAFSCNKNLYIIDVNGTNLKKITEIDPTTKKSADYPSWSANGAEIIFIEQEQQQGVIYAMTLNNSVKKKLSGDSDRKFYSIVSPDGSKIVYGIWNTDLKDMVLYLMKTDGTSNILLTK